MFYRLIYRIGGRELAKVQAPGIPPEGRIIHIADTIFGRSAYYRVARVVEHLASSGAHTSIAAQQTGNAFDLTVGDVWIDLIETTLGPAPA